MPLDRDSGSVTISEEFVRTLLVGKAKIELGMLGLQNVHVDACCGIALAPVRLQHPACL